MNSCLLKINTWHGRKAGRPETVTMASSVPWSSICIIRQTFMDPFSCVFRVESDYVKKRMSGSIFAATWDDLIQSFPICFAQLLTTQVETPYMTFSFTLGGSIRHTYMFLAHECNAQNFCGERLWDQTVLQRGDSWPALIWESALSRWFCSQRSWVTWFLECVGL